jgi:uroporphyrinogen-III synthase
MAKYKVLSTKILKASLVDQVKGKGIEFLQQDFIATKPIEAIEENIRSLLSKQNLVFTSANAVNIVTKVFKEFPEVRRLHKIFCLAGKTKQSLLENGFEENKIAGEGENATALAKEIIRHGVKDIVFFCGNRRREELPSILKSAGVTVNELAIYTTSETSLVISDGLDAILFFSPSGVNSFFTSNKIKESAVCFTIGQTTADAVKQHTTNKIIISKDPSQEAITEAVITYFQNINQNND